MFYSLKFRLMVICLLAITIPMACANFILPLYYQNIVSSMTTTMTESAMKVLSRNIDAYLKDVQNSKYVLYTNQEFMRALNARNGKGFPGYSDYDRFKVEEKIQEMLSNMLSTRNDVNSCLFAANDGMVYLKTKKEFLKLPAKDFGLTEKGWFILTKNQDGRDVFAKPSLDGLFPGIVANSGFSISYIVKDTDAWSFKRLGMVLIDINTEQLAKIFEDVKFDVSSTVAVTDDSGSLIFSNHGLSQGIIRQLGQNNKIIEDGDVQYLTYSYPIGRAHWKMNMLLSNAEIQKKLRGIYYFDLLYAVGVSLVTFLIFIMISRQITNPFMKITRVLKSVKKGDLNARVNIRGKDEVSGIAVSFDEMLDRISDLIDREYKAVLSRRNAEYLALQSQINPHFLFNTLNGFLALNRSGKSDRLDNAIRDLTGMMRYSLESRKGWATVAEEFDFVERYCNIQKIRFEERLSFELYYDEAAGGCKIPKLLLQPLVENSVIHGIEKLSRQGFVEMRAEVIEKQGEAFLQILIMDNGAGFDVEKQENEKSVGLANVRERLSFAYPLSVFTIESKPGDGTVVKIEIPQKDGSE